MRAVFGPSASAAAVGKLLSLDPTGLEDALGIACTQACGLMSAQFGSMVKRMQHGFASRNGLSGAFLAQGGYTGIHAVYEQPYGGFMQAFSAGSTKDPPYSLDELTKLLGRRWHTESINIKPYASMAATHGVIDCIAALQNQYPERFVDLEDITDVFLEISEPAYKHAWWKAERPFTATSAQMHAAFVAAVQIHDAQVLPAQFADDMLNRDAIWNLIEKTRCLHNTDFDGPDHPWRQRVTVTFSDGTLLSHLATKPKGVNPPLTNDEILLRWRTMTERTMSITKSQEIEALVLGIERVEDITELTEALNFIAKNPLGFHTKLDDKKTMGQGRRTMANL
ncbi:hypothetical protein E4T39_08720 [Aureobasidium subglaciale]|nr:hypothetical protein E4T39_08720 [Aureobasidium subglaciale]